MRERPAWGQRKSSGSLVVSVALHIIVGAALFQILLDPLPIGRLFRRTAQPAVEHLHFVETPTRGATTQTGRSGGNNRAVTKETPEPLAAPVTIPNTLPPVPPAKAAAPSAPVGAGPVIGVGGPAQGIRPEYADPRVWVPPSPGESGPKNAQERADSVIQQHIQAHNDSMLASAGFKKPGDWTFTHNGKKYGMDQQYIHLGPISIPNAILALLPINHVQGNPMEGADEARYDAQRNEINQQAQRGMDEASFNEAIRKERQRMDLEHQHHVEEEQQHPPAAPSDQTPPPAPPTASQTTPTVTTGS